MRFATLVLLVFFTLISNASSQTDSAQQLFDQSMSLFRQAKFEKIISDCDAVEDKNLAALATGLKAIALSELGDNEEATAAATSAVTMTTNEPWELAMVYSCQGYVQIRQGLHDDAMVSIEKAIELAEGESFPGYVKSFIYYYRGQNQKCIETANEYLQLTPKDAMTLSLRGIAESNQFRSAKALDSLSRAMQVDPDYVGGAVVLAMELTSQGDTNRAFQILDAAEKINEKHYTIYTARGYAYQIEQDTKKMEACIQKAYQLNDRNIEPLTAYGYFLIQEGRFEEAEPIVERCVERYPNNYHSTLMKGFFHAKQDEIDEAIKQYEQSYQVNPTQVRPILMQGLTYFDVERYEEALVPFRQIKKQNPKHWFGILNLGLTYSKLGQHQEAIREYSDALDLKSDDPYIYLMRAESFRAVGALEKSDADLAKAKELQGEDER